MPTYKNKLLEKRKEKEMSSTQQRLPQSSGFRHTIFLFFVILAMLYVVYSSYLLLYKDRQCITKVDNLDFLTNMSTLFHLNDEQDQNSLEPILFPQKAQTYSTEVKHIVFGIAASANLWEKRKEYVKTWWRPRETRGIVWMDRKVRTRRNEGLPEIRVSKDTSKFKYTNRQGHRSAIRISRVVSEALRLGLKDVRWFVMGDDDTVFVVDNVVRILSKYDHRQFYYVGSSSESHLQNIYFSYSMAYGGGGFAISYPLALELAKMQENCIQRYPGLYGSDDRIQACMAELGVPLTKEPGFHQVYTYIYMSSFLLVQLARLGSNLETSQPLEGL